MASASSFPPPALDSCGRMRPWAAAGETLLLPPPSPPRAATVRAGGRAEAVARAHAASRRYVKRNRLCERSPTGEGGHDRGGAGMGGAEGDHAPVRPRTTRPAGPAPGAGPNLAPPINPAQLLLTGSWGLKRRARREAGLAKPRPHLAHPMSLRAG